MHIAIISINYAPDQTGIAVYTTGMAEYLAQTGHQVTVHTGFSYYPMWRKAAADRHRWHRREEVNKVSLRRSYLYVPASPSPIRRMLHEASFALTSFLSYLFAPRADVTIVVTPPLPGAMPLLLAARLKRSRSILHVQDLQPDVAVNLGMLGRGPLTSFLYALERQTYAQADYISSISHGMLEAIKAKGVPQDKLFLFRNWANDSTVRPRDRATAYREEWGLGEKFVVLYSGNLGVKQGLEMMLDAAQRLVHQADIVFVIVGDGGERDRLIGDARRRRLTNVIFKPLQPFAQLEALLATADVSAIPQRPGVNDIVMPSKLGNILASGRPLIVAADAGTELETMVRSAGCGHCVEPGNARAMARAVLRLRGSPEECARLGLNGIKLTQTSLSEHAVLSQFAAKLEEITRDAGLETSQAS